jgi:hypothetical protein
VPPSAPADPPGGAPVPCAPHLLSVEDEPDLAVMLRRVFQEARARACGAEGVAPEPFDVDALLATAARLVRRPKAG